MDSQVVKPKFIPSADLLHFQEKNKSSRVIDTYINQLEELFLIRNPRIRFQKDYQSEFENFLREFNGEESFRSEGSWFYFSWSNCLIHFLPEDLHLELKTARNKNLITKEEQERYYHCVVGVAGLSVGSHAALTIAMTGGAKKIKLADPDTIAVSNLNRVRFDSSHVGMNKAVLVAQTIYQMNPYADIYLYPNGVSSESIDEFLNGDPGLDVLVEELDNLEMKLRLRLKAREFGIPVIMATDNGDNIIMDVERYDLDRSKQIFHGLLGDITLEEFRKIEPEEMSKVTTRVAGKEFVVPRMQDSLLEVGKTLYSWPQLGTAATLSGVAAAYAVRRLANGQRIRDGKFEVNLDAIFDPDYFSRESKMYRQKKKISFLNKICLEK
ncbi:MAG: ThiF family adenylyltransferase [Planctomycetes bacterium]|nr:ThiF family adenylyltransferase [Planctomycetota bacterium]